MRREQFIPSLADNRGYAKGNSVLNSGKPALL
jgi:hypothetical protein